MKPNRLKLHALALVASLLTVPTLFAHEGRDHAKKDAPASGQLVAPTEKDAAWLAQARSAYPLKTCVVSGDEFGGEMGEVIDRIYREKDKPDRLIRFCCDGCLEDFEKDPAEFLSKLDKPDESKSGHSKHQH